MAARTSAWLTHSLEPAESGSHTPLGRLLSGVWSGGGYSMLDEAPPPPPNQSAGSGICRSGDGESQESVNTLGAVASGEAGAEDSWSELSSS
eukprot:3021126-Pleurochrysis_carterae.AAC.1